MKEGYRLLGDFIRQVDVRNTDGKEENLLGVSVQKMFIPSIANTVGTDFTKYKVVKRGQFTYIPDTSRRGDKVGIALLTDYDEGLVSNIYTVFEVKDENELLPEYLMLWFSRPEFDRYKMVNGNHPCYDGSYRIYAQNYHRYNKRCRNR